MVLKLMMKHDLQHYIILISVLTHALPTRRGHKYIRNTCILIFLLRIIDIKVGKDSISIALLHLKDIIPSMFAVYVPSVTSFSREPPESPSSSVSGMYKHIHCLTKRTTQIHKYPRVQT